MRGPSALLLSSLLLPKAYAAAFGAWNGPWPGFGQKLVKPKVFLIDMFSYEANVWYNIPDFNLLARNITVPGFSPEYPDVHCTAKGDICQLVTGEGEINAAATMAALVFSGKFDLTTTYFFIAGIAGVSPETATISSVTFARYAVQVALQYEFDIRDLPSNWTTGYVPFGTKTLGQYPQSIYGTEVFEMNVNLRDIAIAYASKAKLNDSAAAISYRAKYAPNPLYAAATKAPSVIACDVATSDVYYSGALLAESFSNFTRLITNGTGNYCATAQEDNASLEVLVRAAKAKLVDFARVIVMRTASDFERPYPGEAATTNLFYADQGAFEPAAQNIYLAGREVIHGIISNWDKTFKQGIKPSNYIGDIFATLGGTPDFGPYKYNNNPTKRKRFAMKRGLSR